MDSATPLRFARNDAGFFFALYAFLCVLCGEMVFL